MNLELIFDDPISSRPVINSPRFYGLFGEVKRQFERQEITHGAAGTFLRTIKTLMAKLKVWRLFYDVAWFLIASSE